jgi:cysteine-rich repeat protein
VNGDGCESDCKKTSGWKCFTHPVTKISECCNFNGKWESGEECDDGNKKDGDGCSSTCRVETGYMCHTGFTDFVGGEKRPKQKID